MASNGQLDASTLSVLPGFDPYPPAPNYRAVSAADGSNLILSSILTDGVNMAADFKRDTGQTLTYAEAYRNLDIQRARKSEQANGGSLAATPGYSNHGWAAAIDYRNSIGSGPGNVGYDWMKANAKNYGFVEDVPGEHWHWHHPSTTSLTKPRIDSAGTGTEIILTPVGDIMASTLIKVTAKKPGLAANVFLVNPDTMQCMHIDNQIQVTYWTRRGVKLLPDVQPWSVLNNFTRVGGAGAI